MAQIELTALVNGEGRITHLLVLHPHDARLEPFRHDLQVSLLLADLRRGDLVLYSEGLEGVAPLLIIHVDPKHLEMLTALPCCQISSQTGAKERRTADSKGCVLIRSTV